MNIRISNCNNIDDGEIIIIENKLNIKYAVNGTGKSTISKAIVEGVADRANQTSELTKLKPFKYFANSGIIPSITGIDELASVRIFNDEYVNDYVFRQDELVKGSFDIFVRNADYDSGINEIEALVKEIKILLSEDKEIESLKSDFNEIISAFGKDTKKGFHGSSALSKAFKGGNKVENIPQGLEIFKDYIHSTENIRWVKWQQDGKFFIDLSENCPYCINDITSRKDTIKKLSDSYDSKIIENMSRIVNVFQRLNAYFSESTKVKIDEFVKSINGPTDDQADFLKEVKGQIERLKLKFENAQNIGFHSLKDVDKVVDELNNYRIDLSLFNHLSSNKTNDKVKILNDALTKIAIKAGLLQGCVKRQQRLIEEIVNSNRNEINSFLSNAGYKYAVNLTEEPNGERRLKLFHVDYQDSIPDARAHLSFGERNAISLVLFMYDALKANPSLIILDDPISSFDKNKKYAIVEMLFKKEKFLKGKTVLLLTHDFDPIVDMILVHGNRFEVPYATFLENRSGCLREKEIAKRNVRTFIDICNDNINSDSNIINKLVYLRRLYEITRNSSMGYQLLSNAFHKRAIPEKQGDGETVPMTPDEIMQGENEILESVNGFRYDEILLLLNNDSNMIHLYETGASNYDKLHYYRILFEGKQRLVVSDVIMKFINETFHIENNFIYQVNPREYQVVPQYIIDECDKHIEILKRAS